MYGNSCYCSISCKISNWTKCLYQVSSLYIIMFWQNIKIVHSLLTHVLKGRCRTVVCGEKTPDFNHQWCVYHLEMSSSTTLWTSLLMKQLHWVIYHSSTTRFEICTSIANMEKLFNNLWHTKHIHIQQDGVSGIYAIVVRLHPAALETYFLDKDVRIPVTKIECTTTAPASILWRTADSTLQPLSSEVFSHCKCELEVYTSFFL